MYDMYDMYDMYEMYEMYAVCYELMIAYPIHENL